MRTSLIYACDGVTGGQGMAGAACSLLWAAVRAGDVAQRPPEGRRTGTIEMPRVPWHVANLVMCWEWWL